MRLLLLIALLPCASCAIDPFGGEPRSAWADGVWRQDPRGFKIGLQIQKDPIEPGEETAVTFIIENTSDIQQRIPTPDENTLDWQVEGDADIDRELDLDGETIYLVPGASRRARVTIEWDEPGEYLVRAILRSASKGSTFEPIASGDAHITVASPEEKP